MSKDSETKRIDDEMKTKAAAEAKPVADATTPKPAADTSKPKPETKPEPKPETKSEPETKPETVLISKEEYENVRRLIRFNNDLADKLGRMSEVVEGLTKQVASLGGKVGELERQIDGMVEKPVLVYRATFADGEETVSDKETDIYARGMLPKRLIQVYAWKNGSEFEPLDDDELEELGLKNP